MNGTALVALAKYMAVFGNVIGFIWKEKVGAVAGSWIQEVFRTWTGLLR